MILFKRGITQEDAQTYSKLFSWGYETGWTTQHNHPEPIIEDSAEYLFWNIGKELGEIQRTIRGIDPKSYHKDEWL